MTSGMRFPPARAVRLCGLGRSATGPMLATARPVLRFAPRSPSRFAAACCRAIREERPYATFSTSFPKLPPEKSLPSASGKFSSPSTTSSRLFMRPSLR